MHLINEWVCVYVCMCMKNSHELLILAEMNKENTFHRGGNIVINNYVQLHRFSITIR